MTDSVDVIPQSGAVSEGGVGDCSGAWCPVRGVERRVKLIPCSSIGVVRATQQEQRSLSFTSSIPA